MKRYVTQAANEPPPGQLHHARPLAARLGLHGVVRPASVGSARWPNVGPGRWASWLVSPCSWPCSLW